MHAVTLGAIQCNDAWMWSDVPSYLPPDAVDVPGAVIPLGHQPRLQLSLDVPLWEHYGDVLSDGPPRSLPSAANPFGLAWSENADDCIRLGSWFEPIINCHGLWYNGGFNDYPATSSATHSAMWLSILDADLPLQLTFLLMENSWADSGALRNDGWLQTVAVQTWGAQARMLAPSFYPVFGSFPPEPHRYVSVETATLLRRDVAPDSTPVRARAWREVCGPETNSSGICVHLMVVNTVQDSAVSFTLRLLLKQLRQEDGASGRHAQAWAFPMQASALFETGGYNVTVGVDGRLSDFIGPGQTLIYELGCNGPRQLAPGAGRGTGTDEYVQPPWLSCANRRVQCIHGFINNVSGGPPAPNGGRCGKRKPSKMHVQLKTDDTRTTETLIHVAAGGGSAVADGSMARAFSSVHEARDAMRAGLGRGRPRTVLIEGQHFLHTPLQLDERDTGTAAAPVTYRSRSAANPARLSGGIRLPSTAFRAATVPSGAPGVRKIDLFDHGFNASMLPALAAVPNQGSGFLTGAPELFVDGRAMLRARSPNVAPDGEWVFAGYENMSGPTFNASFTQHSDTSFVFTDASLAPLWKQATQAAGVWLHGYFQWDWRDTYIQVSSIEQMSGASAWNVTRAEGTPPGPDSQFTRGSRFYALAALELLDSPGEYHINSTTGELWLLPMRPLTVASELVVSVLDNVIDAKVAHHNFLGLEISDSRGQLVVVTGANNLVQSCTITNSGGTCAAAAGTNNSLRNNTIYGCGMAGVSLFAGMPTGALVAGNASVVGCHITNVSRIARTCEYTSK